MTPAAHPAATAQPCPPHPLADAILAARYGWLDLWDDPEPRVLAFDTLAALAADLRARLGASRFDVQSGRKLVWDEHPRAARPYLGLLPPLASGARLRRCLICLVQNETAEELGRAVERAQPRRDG